MAVVKDLFQPWPNPPTTARPNTNPPLHSASARPSKTKEQRMELLTSWAPTADRTCAGSASVMPLVMPPAIGARQGSAWRNGLCGR
ncbi:hypothetical protein [Streptomyces puniciscabiei]|uniref:hypothetical protein n=1 Tax=Streptomyces puniciscabiei TaxID=164348 RepID=UPI00378BE309